MVNYIEKRDIFRVEGVSSYAHGCNCAGAMGKGIAVLFKERFPEMYLQYRKLCKEGKFVPGDVFVYHYADGYVFNLGTQATWRTKATMENIRQSLVMMMEQALELNVYSIAMPAIGAGLGGLKWDDVKRVVQEIAAAYPQIDLHVVEQYSGKR